MNRPEISTLSQVGRMVYQDTHKGCLYISNFRHANVEAPLVGVLLVGAKIPG